MRLQLQNTKTQLTLYMTGCADWIIDLQTPHTVTGITASAVCRANETDYI